MALGAQCTETFKVNSQFWGIDVGQVQLQGELLRRKRKTI
jgi:hypothetical protein